MKNRTPERRYYIKDISEIFKQRVTKEAATRAMSDAADNGHPYQVKQGRTFWKRIHTTTVEV